jgi:hypothetical protein
MHPGTAQCYANLGLVLFHAGDAAQALVHQKKAVIISERVNGLDAHTTISYYK